MGRKKSIPKRTDSDGRRTSTADSSGEYLGLYGDAAATANNSQETTRRQDGVSDPGSSSSRKEPNTETHRPCDRSAEVPYGAEGEVQPRHHSTNISTSGKKGVTFSEDPITTEIEALPPPEVEIVTEYIVPLVDSDPNKNGEAETVMVSVEDNLLVAGTNRGESTSNKRSILRYNYDPSRHPDHTNKVEHGTSTRAAIPLRRFRLATDLRLEVTAPTVTENDDNQGGDTFLRDAPYQIYTAKGADELVQFCLSSQSTDVVEYDETKVNHTPHETDNIALAVEHGFFHLAIEKCSPDTNMASANENANSNQQHYEVVLSLSDRAFETCRPSFLPVKSSKASNVYQAMLCLHRALAELYPKDKEFFPLGSRANTSERTITAKKIYALVDNVQFKAFLGKKKLVHTASADSSSSGTLNIPGLVPTLRPYQEAAVQWMLERERGSTTHLSTSGSDEWELAWVVVHPYADQMPKQCSKRQVVFLPEHMQHYPERMRQQKDQNRFFFCPFTGWLAFTLEEAKTMTLTIKNDAEQSGVARGGILAESMGLGKTVEVLSCILANPDPERHSYLQDERLVNVVSSSSSSSSLSSGESSAVSAEIGAPGELFETQNNGDDSGVSKKREEGGDQVKRNEVSVDSYVVSTCESDSQHGLGLSAPTNLEENWIDGEEVELGACICGKLISLFPSPPTNSIVLCSECREPMHWFCAAFKSERGQLSLMPDGVLFRKKFSDESFSCKLCPTTFCPCCSADRTSRKGVQGGSGKIPSRATVIVTPPAILSQWEREIKLHTRIAKENNDTKTALKVFVYPGVKNLCREQVERSDKHKDERFCLLHPRWLADADIVLMTFDALRHDLGHSDSNPYAAGAERTSLRKRKRYRVVPSPLSSIHWWRVCLDEAQRVETPTAGSAQMALKLQANFRWAVSGTPIGRGKLDDLFGLLLFLQVTLPFNEKDWFRQCFSSFANDSYLGNRIRHLLGRVFWRSTKSLDIVAAQMGVPPQVEQKNVLKFSSVEKHFYNRQLETTLEIATDISSKQKGGFGKRKRKGGNSSLDVLAGQLHKLRAACCHPQVGSHGLAKKSRGANSDGMKVLSMAEVLDRLIDDAKNQCEEALRVVLYHTNPMAAIARLKVEARKFHQLDMIKESDEFLFSQSCKFYQDALDLADENAAPSLVISDALLSGNRGFRSSHKHFRGGRALLDWQIQRNVQDGETLQQSSECGLWVNFDYHGQSKKMCQIRLRTVQNLPADLMAGEPGSFSWRLRYPRECVLQVANTAVGGEYVDILSFSLPEPKSGGSPENTWIVHGGFWIYRSKLWRLQVKSFHDDIGLCRKSEKESKESLVSSKGDYLGIEVELYEPTIGSDSLQRLHTLHNSVISLQELQSVQSSSMLDREGSQPSQRNQPTHSLPSIEIEQRLVSMETDVARIEQYHLEYAKTIRSECMRHLSILSSKRQHLELELFDISEPCKGEKQQGFWDVAWWDDTIVTVKMRGTPTEQVSLCEKVLEAIDDCETFESDKMKAFPAFSDLQGLHVALKLRLDDSLSNVVLGQYTSCIQSVLKMSPDPTEGEVLENQTCSVCKADWAQTGPKCRHCIVGEKLKAIDIDNQKLERAILDAIWKWSKSSRAGVRSSSTMNVVTAVGTKFFEVCEAARKEVLAASRLWRVHLDLLNVIDELNSCKTSMRLVHEGEDVSALTEEQKGSVIVPIDICTRAHEHAAKQAMALANLRRHKHTLTFLKNQTTEEADSATSTEDSEDTCMVCLSAFNSDRAVLACGHSFHITPCVEKLKKRSGGSSLISCPLRCTVRTKYEDILIASSKRNDDGTQSKRKVIGSWGTKVTAIVSDLLVVSDLGEKSIVFSMWEDMLDIMEEALNANGLKFVRASSLARIGEATKSFRSSDCFVLLLNVKNGAEGLNLIEATHVFMIEPLLNCGLDSQATARNHRIGQTRQTYLHRYLIEDTIEIKVDKYREQHQEEEQLEDAIMDSRRCAIQAGGIDGGFSSKEELMDMLSL